MTDLVIWLHDNIAPSVDLSLYGDWFLLGALVVAILALGFMLKAFARIFDIFFL